MGSLNGRLRQRIRAGQAGRRQGGAEKDPPADLTAKTQWIILVLPVAVDTAFTTTRNEARKSRLRQFQKARMRFDRSRELCYNLTSLVETRPVETST